MLRGAWPRVTSGGLSAAQLEGELAAGRGSADDLEALVERLAAEAVEAQVGAGMGLVTDGAVRWADQVAAVRWAIAAGDTGAVGMLARAWRATAALTNATVAQVVPGPLTLAGLAAGLPGDAGGATATAARAVALAPVLAGEIAALTAAGCAVVVVDEPALAGVRDDEVLRDGFLRAHDRLLRDAGDQHLMLSVTGGSAHEMGPDAVFGLAYNSYLFDLVAGPDNWYLVRAVPGERGIVCAVLRAAPGASLADQMPELVWAAQYAASARGRGLDRVGLANASSLDGLAPAEATAALDQLGRAAALAALPLAEAVKAGLDPRAVRVMPGPPIEPPP
jgi:methionine synthase II (cobalamin-independent)